MKHEFFDVHHISFDVWLTLIRSNAIFKKERDLLFKEFFSLGQPIEDISTHFRQWDVRFTAINETTGGHLDAEEMLTIILSDLEHDLTKVKPSHLEEYFSQHEKLFLRYHPELIEPELPDYLKKLTDEGISMSILSNTGFIKGKMLRKLLDHLKVGHHFAFQLYSDEIAFSKPSQQAFQALYNGARSHRPVDKKNILHIGDNKNADGFGAENAGMQNAIINSNDVSLLHLNISKYKIAR
ncbi:MAG: HAD family hydrolase [Bacteroidetes bacterium]|nr:HAD family hydrolase [Bacteroidota bacterium]